MKKVNRKIFVAYVLVIAMAIATISFSINITKAADVIQTYAYIAASPNPAGINQDVLVTFFLSNLQPSAGGSGGARFHNYSVTITKPDNTNETRGPYTADAVSNAYFFYRPAQTGVYTFVFTYPGEFTPATTGPGGSSIDTTFLPSKSAPLKLVVQQNPLPVLSGNPAPSNYWVRPVNDQNYAWDVVANNWLMPAWDSTTRQFDQGSLYIPGNWANGPDSAHVLWTKPMTFGGLVGGEYGNTQFTDGRSYEQFFKPPVVIGGRLYYNTIQAEEPVTQWNFSSITCVDMKDGSTVFTIPNATLSFGQIFNYVSPNQAGALAYLWETRSVAGVNYWRMFDAWTGNYILSINNVPSGTILLDNTFYGQSKAGPGDILVYSYNANTQILSMWNSSKCIPTLASAPNGSSYGSNAWQWRPYNIAGSTLNAVGNSTVFLYSYATTATINTDGTQWAVNIGSTVPKGGNPSIKQVGYDNTIYISNGTSPPTVIFAQPLVSYWSGYSMVDGSNQFGPTLLDLTSKTPQNASMLLLNGLQTRVIGPGHVVPMWCKETMQFFAWNVSTGAFLWGPTATLNTSAFGLYNWESKLIANGIVYNWGYDGVLHAYNFTNGAFLWEFSSGDAGTNTPYGTWPIYNGLTIADGKLFTQTSDHGNGVEPLYQGEAMYVLDPITGRQLWNMTGWFEQPVIADGKYMSHNCYDNQIYCLAKGPTAVTLTASTTGGSGLMLQGTVTDQSPGAKKLVNDGIVSIVPAVSETSMSAYMEYLYQQQQIPADTTGVQVSLTAVGPNGGNINIGTVTTDASGMFSMMWTPPAQGAYTVVATFAGSNSYWPSYMQIAAGMQAAGATTSPSGSPSGASPTPSGTSGPSGSTTPTTSTSPRTSPSAAPPPASPMNIALYAGIAAIIIIVIIAIVAIILRRR